VLLSKQEFMQIVETAKARYGEPKAILQINYYYDDDDYSMNKQGVTVRVRQCGDSLKLQIKENKVDVGGCRVSNEAERLLSELPGQIDHSEHGTLMLKGNLVTNRHRFKINENLTLDLDENFYLGQHDYELELEVEDGQTEAAECVLAELGVLVKEVKKVDGKATRFNRYLIASYMHFLLYPQRNG